MARIRDVQRALAQYQPVMPQSAETAALVQLDGALRDEDEGRLTIRCGDADTPLPPSVDAIVRRVVHELARGNGIRVLPVHAELTTREAAELLNVSRPYLCKLIDEHEIPAKTIGTHRRVRLDDLLDYKAKIDGRREEALTRLAAASEKYGLPF